MGVTHVTTRISNLAQDAEPWEAEFLVDTGRNRLHWRRENG